MKIGIRITKRSCRHQEATATTITQIEKTSPRTSTQHRVIKGWAKPRKGKAASSPKSQQTASSMQAQSTRQASAETIPKTIQRCTAAFQVLRISSMATASSMRAGPVPTAAKTQQHDQGVTSWISDFNKVPELQSLGPCNLGFKTTDTSPKPTENRGQVIDAT